MRSLRALSPFAVPLAVLVSACSSPDLPTTPAAVPPAAPALALDSLRGIVSVIRVGPDREVVLLYQTSGVPTVLIGATALAAKLDGGDVLVRGRFNSAGSFDVSTTALRALDGEPARDGLLIPSAAGLALRTQDGTQIEIVDPPAELRAHVGRHVWIVGASDAAPSRFGVLPME